MSLCKQVAKTQLIHTFTTRHTKVPAKCNETESQTLSTIITVFIYFQVYQPFPNVVIFPLPILLLEQVAQLSQRDRAAVWVSCGANINVVFRIQRTLL